MNTTGLGKKIKHLRKQKGLTGEQLASLCNVSPVHIRRIESESGGNPSLELFIKICNVLQANPDFLLQDLIHYDNLTVDNLALLRERISLLSPMDVQIVNQIVDLVLYRDNNE